MIYKKKIALCVSCLLNIGISSGSRAMDSAPSTTKNRGFSPNSLSVLRYFHKSSDSNIKFLRRLDEYRDVFLYSFNDKQFVLKRVSRGEQGYKNEMSIGELLNKINDQRTVGALHGTRLKCPEGSKYYLVSPFVGHVSEEVLFNFINYSNWKSKNPNQFRQHQEKVNMWTCLVKQLVGALKILNENKIVHHDIKLDNILFNIDETNNKLTAKIIDFDGGEIFDDHGSKEFRTKDLSMMLGVLKYLSKFFVRTYPLLEKKIPGVSSADLKFFTYVRGRLDKVSEVVGESGDYLDDERYKTFLNDLENLLVNPNVTVNDTIFGELLR